MDNTLPVHMWLVTRERVRAGKPPMKFLPIAYDYSGDKPTWIRASAQRGSEPARYLAADCYASLIDATNAMESIIKAELHHEQDKLNKVRSRLLSARKASKKLTG